MKYFVFALTFLTFSACTGVPSGGGTGFGDQIGGIANDWKKGEQQVQRGQTLVKRGEAMIVKGERQSREGAERAVTARQNLAGTTKSYADAVASDTSNSDLARLSRAVKDAEKRLDSATKQKQDGTRNLRDGERRISEGQALIAQGEARMKAAEAAYERDVDRSTE